MGCEKHVYTGQGECPQCEAEQRIRNRANPPMPAVTRVEDVVNHPKHYTSHPSGVECIQVTEHMNFNVGNAVKYLWRCDEKGAHIEDLKKAAWYVAREIQRREKNVTR